MIKPNKEVYELLKNSNKVAIFVHIKPDGDCLGSASALKQVLLKLGKEADIYCDDIVPSSYRFIKHISEVLSYNDINKDKEYDLAVAVDCSDANRMGKCSELFKNIPTSLKIDHHKTVEDFASLNIVEDLSSTCLILYYYFKDFVAFDADIAEALYAGIATDTGGFMHGNTGQSEHYVASELISYGFDLENANYLLFKKRTLNQAKLIKLAYSSIKFYNNDRIAIISVMQEDLKESNSDRNDTHGFADFASNIEGVMVGVSICEDKKGLFSVSFRTRSAIDLSKLAKTFGGGGHEKAAGCNIFGQKNTVIKKIIEALNPHFKKIDKKS